MLREHHTACRRNESQCVPVSQGNWPFTVALQNKTELTALPQPRVEDGNYVFPGFYFLLGCNCLPDQVRHSPHPPFSPPFPASSLWLSPFIPTFFFLYSSFLLKQWLITSSPWQFRILWDLKDHPDQLHFTDGNTESKKKKKRLLQPLIAVILSVTAKKQDSSLPTPNEIASDSVQSCCYNPTEF